MLVNKRRFIIFLTVLGGAILMAGSILGYALAKGPQFNETNLTPELEIETFVKESVDKNIDFETIKSEAMKIARKNYLQIVFIEESFEVVKVNIIKDLDGYNDLIASFKIKVNK